MCPVVVEHFHFTALRPHPTFPPSIFPYRRERLRIWSQFGNSVRWFKLIQVDSQVSEWVKSKIRRPQTSMVNFMVSMSHFCLHIPLCHYTIPLSISIMTGSCPLGLWSPGWTKDSQLWAGRGHSSLSDGRGGDRTSLQKLSAKGRRCFEVPWGDFT